jgi:hypothetical protein
MIEKKFPSATIQQTGSQIMSGACNRQTCPICGDASLRQYQPFLPSVSIRFGRRLRQWIFRERPVNPIWSAIAPPPIIRPFNDNEHDQGQGTGQAA